MIEARLVRGKMEVKFLRGRVPKLDKAMERIEAQWNPRRGTWVLPPFVRVHHLEALGYGEVKADKAVLERESRIDRLLRLKQMDDVEISGVVDSLDPYQRVGAKFLVEAERAILADDLGLGKTAQSIAASDLCKAKRVLIVARKPLIPHWLGEIEKFSLRPDAMALDSKNNPAGARFVVSSYERVVRRQQDLYRVNWDVVIVDAATMIKSRTAKRTQNIWTLAKKARYCWLLSGKLVRNQPDELWSLLHALYPETYSSYWAFRRRVCREEPIYGPGGYVLGYKVVGLKNPELMRYELEPIVLSRTRAMLGLPPITHETVWVGMSDRQRRLYRQLRKTRAALLKDRVLAPSTALEEVMRLREIACDPRMLGEPVAGEKTVAVVDIVRELLEGGHKVLVFSGWRRLVDLVAGDLRRELGDVCVVYHGGVSDRGRAEAIRQFEDGERPVMVATYQTAGEGLNLQTADSVVWLDKPWSPVDVEEAEGRAWRRGQQNPVHVIAVLTQGTVEEYVERVLRGKMETQQALRVLRESA